MEKRPRAYVFLSYTRRYTVKVLFSFIQYAVNFVMNQMVLNETYLTDILKSN